MTSFYEKIQRYVPGDQVVQVNAAYYARKIFSAFHDSKRRVIDVGCGSGNAVEIFRAIDPAVEYVGIDIVGSIESTSRVRTDFEFSPFNGVNIPYPDNSFDIAYSSQVLEHCRYPESLLQETFRVLKPGGFLVGAVSYLEPFHSDSITNFTPYGFVRVVEACGFSVRELRPGIDSIALITRAYTGDHKSWNRYFSEMSPLNSEILEDGRRRNLSNKTINVKMLEFSGTFGFEVIKPN